MKSTRLPGKILLPLPFSDGLPMISRIINSLNKSRYGGQIIVATSKDKENDILINYLESIEVAYFRGEELNVLSRFVTITESKSFDVVVRITSDNPILDYDLLDEVLDNHIRNNNDYTFTTSLPVGMNFEIIKGSSLISLATETLSDADKEHVTLFIKNSKKFKKQEYIFKEIFSELLKLRITVDYPADYALLSLIYTILKNKETIRYNDLFKIHQNFPWIFEVNEMHFQKQQFLNLNDEIQESTRILEYYDYKASASLLKNNSN